MSYKVTSQPAVEPVTLAEAKNWLKVIGTTDDSLITMLIESTRQTLEDRLDLKFITQTVVQKIDKWPAHSVEFNLETYPVQSVTSIEYKTGTGTATFSTDQYTADTTRQPARIYLNEGATWPTLKAEQEAVSITFVAGYGDTADDVPVKLKQLLLHLLAYAYENRMNPINERVTYIDKLVHLHRNFTFE
jgi:uncharacterized phiE125 gp8 family phage protein